MPSPLLHAFVPCRAGSQRIPGKNTRPFAGWPGGLTELKLRQLGAAESVASIVLSTDDPAVRAIGERVSGELGKELRILERPARLAIADSLDALLAHVAELMPAGVVAWTHVTSPFFGARQLDAAAAAYAAEVVAGPYDSLMAVTPLRSFLWGDEGCLSHDRSQVKWPQTQDLPPRYEVNSALFLLERDELRRRLDRIGDHPFLFTTDVLEGLDIDWPADFALAERLAAGLFPQGTLP